MSTPSALRLICLLCALLVAQPLLNAHAADVLPATDAATVHDDHCAPDHVPDVDCDDCEQACAACLIVGSSFVRPALAAMPALASAPHDFARGPPAADRDRLYRPPIHA